MSIQDIFAVTGKKALVTGGASGIGLAIAEALAENGATVAIVDQNKEISRTTSRTIGFEVLCGARTSWRRLSRRDR